MKLEYIEHVLETLNTQEQHDPPLTMENASEEQRETIVLLAEQLQRINERRDQLVADYERLRSKL